MAVLSRLFSGAILLALAFVLLRVSQPYVQSYQFERMMRRELRTGAARPDVAGVHRRVLEQARSMGFIVAEDDVQVGRLVRGYEVDVRYSVPVDLHFFKPAIGFRAIARSTTQLEPQ